MNDDMVHVADEQQGNERGERRSRSGGSAFPQFAIDVAGRQLDRAGEALTSAADSIDALLARSELPFGGELQGLAGDAARKLRQFGETVSEQDADALIGDVQRRAAANMGVTVAIGAALGAAVAIAFARTAPAAGRG